MGKNGPDSSWTLLLHHLSLKVWSTGVPFQDQHSMQVNGR